VFQRRLERAVRPPTPPPCVQWIRNNNTTHTHTHKHKHKKINQQTNQHILFPHLGEKKKEETTKQKNRSGSNQPSDRNEAKRQSCCSTATNDNDEEKASNKKNQAKIEKKGNEEKKSTTQETVKSMQYGQIWSFLIIIGMRFLMMWLQNNGYISNPLANSEEEQAPEMKPAN